MKKLISSILLTMALIVSFFPVGVMAEASSTAPKIQQADFLKEAVARGGQLSVSFYLGSDSVSSGETTITATLTSKTSSTATMTGTSSAVLSSTNQAIVVNVTASADQLIDDYYMSQVVIKDSSNNSRTYEYNSTRQGMFDTSDSSVYFWISPNTTISVLENDDTTAPLITGIKLSSTSVDKESSVTASVTFNETGSGVKHVSMQFVNIADNTSYLSSNYVSYSPALNSNTQSTASVTITTQKNTTSGTYKLQSVEIKDTLGNSTYYTENGTDTNVGNLTTDQLTVNPSAADSVAPTISNVKILTDTVTNGGKAILQIAFTEEESGLEYINVNAAETDGTYSNIFFRGEYYNQTDGPKTQKIQISANVSSVGTYEINNIEICDKYGNKTIYSSSKVAISSVFAEGDAKTFKVTADALPVLNTTSSASDLVSSISSMASSSTINIKDDKGIIPAGVFEAVRGKNQTVTIYKEDTESKKVFEAVFSGYNVKEGTLQDLSTTVTFTKLDGSLYYNLGSIEKLSFPENTVLPCNMKLSIANTDLFSLCNAGSDMREYYENAGTLVKASTSVSADASTNLVSFDIAQGEVYFCQGIMASPSSEIGDAPLITSAVINQDSIKLGEIPTVTLTLSDSNMGIASVAVFLISQDSTGTGFISGSESYNPLNTSSTITVSLPGITQEKSGTYQINQIDITASNGYKREYQLINNVLRDTNYEYVQLSSSDRLVVTAEQNGDLTAPSLNSMNLEKTTVEKKSSVNLNLGFTEESGIKEIQVQLTNTTNTMASPIYRVFTYDSTPVTGSTAAVSIDIPSLTAAGVYKFVMVKLTDIYGNTNSYDESTLSSITTNTLTVASDGDDTAPVINAVNIENSTITRPNVVNVNIDFTETGTGLSSITLFLRNKNGAYISKSNLCNAETGTNTRYVLQVPVTDTDATGCYSMIDLRIEDNSGNNTRYYEDSTQKQISPISSSMILNVNEVSSSTKYTSLSNANLVSFIDGCSDTSTIRIANDINTAPAALFTELKDSKKSVTLYKEGIEWVFNGADITTENIKDINTDATIVVEDGSQYNNTNKVVKLVFPENGTLPGPAKIRLQLEYLSYLYQQQQIGNLKLYFVNNNTLQEESADFTMASDGYLEFTLTHNSTFYISDSSMTLPEATVAATGVTLDQTTLALTAGGTASLTATVAPNTATNKAVTWSSDHGEYASVDTNGKVTAKAAGTAVITATTADGGYQASCTVTVSAAAAPAISNLNWNDQGNDDPFDDTLTFTAPIGYYAVTSSNYQYTIHYGNDEGTVLLTEDAQMTIDQTSGTATVYLSSFDFYGRSSNPAVQIKLVDSVNNVNIQSEKLTKPYVFDTTKKPTNITITKATLNSYKVSFDKFFGAVQYSITQKTSDGRVLISKTVSMNTNNYISTFLLPGDTVSVTANNGAVDSAVAVYTYPDSTLKMDNLKWHENDVANQWDDTLTCTDPENYRSYSAGYNFFLLNTDTRQFDNLYSSNDPIDSNGVQTVTLKSISDYGQKLTYNYVLVIANGSDSSIVSSSNIVHKEFSLGALSTPQNVYAGVKSVGCDKVFGATSYTITHKKKDGTDAESALTSATNTAALTVSTEVGDVLTITASNGTLSSDPASYTVTESLAITGLSVNKMGTDDPWDDELSFIAPEGYRNISYPLTYNYTISFGSSKTSLMGCEPTIEPSTGRITLKLRDTDFGNAYDYKATVALVNSSDVEMTASDPYEFSYTESDLAAPSGIYLTTGNLLRFDRVFGATSYTVKHINSSGTVLQTIEGGTSTPNGFSFADTPSVNDQITIQAKNSTKESAVSTYVVPDVTKIQDFEWNNNKTETDFMDDYASFTAMKGYYTLIDQPYSDYYAIQYASGKEEKLVAGQNCSIDTATGKVTVQLSKTDFYAVTPKIYAKILLYKTQYVSSGSSGPTYSHTQIASSDEIDKEYTTTSIEAPANLVVNDVCVDFDKAYGATKYLVTHYQSDGSTVIDETKTILTNHTVLTTKANVDDVITVVASNDDGSIVSPAAQYKVIAAPVIDTLTWNKNSDSTVYDDTLTFTAPAQYRSFGSKATYYYELRYMSPLNPAQYIMGFDLSLDYPATMDENGLVTIPLSSTYPSTKYSDCIYQVYLICANGKFVFISQSPQTTVTQPFTSLSTPTNLTQSGTGIKFNYVYGADYYIVNRYNAAGELQEGPVTVEGREPNLYYSYSFKELNAFDKITVSAVRERSGETKQTSAVASYTVTGSAVQAVIKSITIKNVNTHIKTGEKPTYSATIELTGDNITEQVTQAVSLSEYWRDTKLQNIINESGVSAENQKKYNLDYSAVFLPKTQYSYCFTIRYVNPTGIGITIADDATVSMEDTDGSTISNIKCWYKYSDASQGLRQFDFIESEDTDPLPQPVTSSAEQKLSVTNSVTSDAANEVASTLQTKDTELNLSENVSDQLGYIADTNNQDNSKVLKDVTSKIAVQEVVTDDANKIKKITLDMDMILNYVGLKSGDALDPVSLHDSGTSAGTVTMKVPLPSDFDAADGEKVIVEHKLSDNTVEDYEGTIVVDANTGTKYLTFTNPSGFSQFSVLSASSGTSVTGVTLDLNTLSLVKGNTKLLTATVAPNTAANQNVTWTSSDDTVATVNNGTVTAVKAGTAKITVTTEDGAKTAVCTVTVTDDTVAATGVSLNKTEDTLEVNGVDFLTAAVLPSNATNAAVTWTSSDETVATVNNGTVTAIKAGKAKITATTADGGFTAECNLTVKAAEVAVTALTLTPATLSMNTGASQALTAVISPDNATNQNVTWTSSDTSVATVANGTVTAVKAGTATITAASAADSTKNASCTVTVSDIAVSSISLSASTLSLDTGKKGTLTASILPADATNQNVTWTSSDTSVATVVNGTVTAVKAGTTTITAAATSDSSKSATCTVTVSDVAVSSLTLSSSTLSLYTGKTGALTASILPADATNQNVTWTSSDTSVATVANGTVTAVKAGTATITAAAASDSSKSATCTVTVSDKPVESVTVTPSTLSIYVGDTSTLTGSVLPGDATNQSVTWKSSDETVATVADGTVKAVKPGTATITASAASDSSKTASCTVTVSDKPVTSVTVTPSTLTIHTGETSTLTPTVLPVEVVNKNVSWESDDPAVVSVDQGTITALKSGTATITVKSTADSTKSASCTVTVLTTVESLSFDKTNETLNVADTLTIQATVSPATAVNKNITWTSIDSSIASVAGGVITANQPGTATITATTEDGQKTASCTVTVHLPQSTVPEAAPSTATEEVKNAQQNLIDHAPDIELNVADVMQNADVESAMASTSSTVRSVTTDIIFTGITTDPSNVVTEVKFEIDVFANLKNSNGDTQQVAIHDISNSVTIKIALPDNFNVPANNKVNVIHTLQNNTDVTYEGTISVESGIKYLTFVNTHGFSPFRVESPVIIAATGVSVSPTELSLLTGESSQLSKSVSPSNATDQSVTWSSSNSNVAAVADGKVTAVSAGKATITAKTNDGGLTSSCTVTVSNPVISVSGISLKPASLQLTTGGTAALTAEISPSNATNKSFGWSSSNTGVASVDNGTVTARAAGTAVITVTTADGGHQASCAVTVTNPTYPVTGVSVDNSMLSLTVGETGSLKASVSPDYATNKSVSWSSSNAGVAAVDNGTVTARTAGTAVITVTTADGGHQASCTVVVKAPEPAPTPSPSVTPTPTVAKQEMYRLYNPNSGEHFYTKDSYERDQLASIGWVYEGVGWIAPATSNTPVYRMYNPNAGEHHYTTNAGEKDMLTANGWNYEGIGWYSDDAQGVPLYRQYNPNAFSCNHNYTVNKSENDWLVSLGWNAEGIGWYGVK